MSSKVFILTFYFVLALKNIRGIGINCSDPRQVAIFGRLMADCFPKLTLITYPNSAETWSNEGRDFKHKFSLTDTGENVAKSGREYFRLGARTRRKKEKKIACSLLDVFACGQVSSPRLYRFINP